MLAASDQTRPGAWLDAAEKLYIAKVPIYNLGTFELIYTSDEAEHLGRDLDGGGSNHGRPFLHPFTPILEKHALLLAPEQAIKPRREHREDALRFGRRRRCDGRHRLALGQLGGEVGKKLGRHLLRRHVD